MNAQDIHVTVDEHTQDGKRHSTPGDNPNKSNAKHRKGNRPKTTNQPKGEKNSADDTMVWYDPLQSVESIPADLQSNFDTVPAGYIDLRTDLPDTIATPFLDAFISVTSRTNLPALTMSVVTSHLTSLSYLKSARQLYSTLSNVDKIDLQPLKAVFYDTAKIPKRMSASMALIGNMDTKLGAVQVRDGPVLFKRWVAAATKIAGHVEDETDPFSLVWNDAASKKLVDRLAKARLEELCSHPYKVQVVGGTAANPAHTEIMVRPPIPAISQAGFDSVDPANGKAAGIRMMVALLSMSVKQWVKEEDLPYEQPLEDALGALNLTIAGDEYDLTSLRVNAAAIYQVYEAECWMHINAVFEMADGPTSGHGQLGQIVQSDDTRAHFKLPLADSDKYFGFMLNPSNGFEIDPRFVAYSRRTQGESLYEYSARDLKSIAK